MTFKDHFSTQASEYTQFRPRYPRELFEFLAGIVVDRHRAWDCGTGNGQAAVALAEFFERVIATDPSARQIAAAEANAKVEYRVAPAEACGLDPASVTLVTVAQALHWFDFDRFYAEVRRVSIPGGVLAAWSYGGARITPAVDHVVGHFYSEIVGPYWPPERQLVEGRYVNIPFPWPEIAAPAFEMTAQWNLRELIGYLGTWSSVQHYRQQQGHDPLDRIAGELAAAWGPAESARTVAWPLFVRVGRVE